ncbi:MAG: hypothetical protein ACJ8F1_07210 [Polyangia bacterium]
MPGRPSVAVVVALMGICGAEPARAQATTAAAGSDRWSIQGELGATLASRSSTAATSVTLARAQALGLSVDRGFRQLHLFARAEANAWRDRRDDGTDDFVLTLDLGVGARFDYGGGRLRSSLALGATLLALPGDVDTAGTVGAFVDVRPLGFAWPLAPGVRLGVLPLSLMLAIPVPTGIPLVSIQYRTTIFAERDF